MTGSKVIWETRLGGERRPFDEEELLDPDVRNAFCSERAVNDALRLVIELRKVGSYKRRDYSSNGT
jgi:hypothetical protein